jgi:hypothetical protein
MTCQNTEASEVMNWPSTTSSRPDTSICPKLPALKSGPARTSMKKSSAPCTDLIQLTWKDVSYPSRSFSTTRLDHSGPQAGYLKPSL